MRRNGFTLVEMLIVIAIAGILMAIAASNFGTWTSKSVIEGQIREMYGDFMNARVRALDTNRIHFVSFNGAQYTITDDTDGNGLLESPPADTVIVQKTMKITITVAGGPLSFDARGLSANDTTLSLSNTAGAVSDCILISQTRINMGFMNGGACAPR